MLKNRGGECRNGKTEYSIKGQECMFKESLLKFYRKFIDWDYATVALPFIGMGLQFLIWLILLPVSFSFSAVDGFYNLLTYSSFAVHGLSLFGVYLAVQQLRSGHSSRLAWLGLGLNVLWCLAFIGICILVLSGVFSV